MDEQNRKHRNDKKRKRPIWFRVLRAVLTAYLLIVVLMVLFERYLVYPAPGSDMGNWQPDAPFEEVRFDSNDGTQLVGWIIEHPAPKFYVLYFHGNAENVALTLPTLLEIRQYLEATVLAVDYRGYGKSGGKPFERGLCADGQAALKFFAENRGLRSDQIVVMGRSVGGAVATYVASENDVQALVLQSTFDEMVGVAAKKFPWISVRLLMRNRFVATAWAERVRCPVIQFHGTADRIVPMQHGQKLHEHFDVPHKSFNEVPGGRHNDANRPLFYQKSKRFFEEIREKR